MSTQPPIEDINAIVSRFQEWAGTQASTRAKDGVRELTYDEAIRQRRPRASSEASSPKAEQPAPTSATNDNHRATGKSAAPKKRIPARRNVKHAQSKDAKWSRVAEPVVVPAPPEFRHVLADKVSAPSQELAMERKTTALSLRVSTVEHALLKRRAEAENLSVSCYLRNCIFEVESLRAQLAATLAEQKQMQSMQMFPFASWVRFVRRIFFRKTTALAIRV
ncbi:hypothetical protein H7849_22890 [Alloacidobacterium dinghuense]|uniref:Uncharacterized protein n=1 Tax=Alloacidobacterium dinghuense TaxID=2763107 RepID=A0A7G8BH27_9BACT|nr:hypothetical protein [Alloacidobacterium dinghuense]QNI31847.1 hypothetical protein H7849_22890 [Alloacidobacterium dinghuense]